MTSKLETWELCSAAWKRIAEVREYISAMDHLGFGAAKDMDLLCRDAQDFMSKALAETKARSK